jgi:hypothetical protein
MINSLSLVRVSDNPDADYLTLDGAPAGDIRYQCHTLAAHNPEGICALLMQSVELKSPMEHASAIGRAVGALILAHRIPYRPQIVR